MTLSEDELQKCEDLRVHSMLGALALREVKQHAQADRLLFLTGFAIGVIMRTESVATRTKVWDKVETVVAVKAEEERLAREVRDRVEGKWDESMGT